MTNASGQQQIPQEKTTDQQSQIQKDGSVHTDDFSSVYGKASKDPLLPKAASPKQDTTPLNPVVEITSTRTSMLHAEPQKHTIPVKSGVDATKNGTTLANHEAKKKTRNWEHFPGKTRYYLGGRVQFGRQYWASIGTAVLIFIPTGLYFAFTLSLPPDLINLTGDAIYGQNIHLRCQ